MHHRWSLCNEYGCVLSEYNVTLTIGKKFRGIIKDLDKSRPISGAWNGDMKLGLMWAEQVTDMFGLNYNYQQCALPPATTRHCCCRRLCCCFRTYPYMYDCQ